MDDTTIAGLWVQLAAKLEELPRAQNRSASDQLDKENLFSLKAHQAELQGQINELRRGQSALERSRDRYMDLYEFAPVGYMTLSLRLVVLHINSTGARLIGADQTRMLGHRFARFVVIKDRERYLRCIRQLKKDGDRRSMDIDLLLESGSTLCAQIDMLRVAPAASESTIRVSITDVTERKQAEAEIKQLAFYDALTLLPNRRFLLDRLEVLLSVIAIRSQHGAILFLDLDDFKTLNDTHGHAFGDMYLQQVARRLLSCVRGCDTVARLGGDEFVVIVENLSLEKDQAAAQAMRVGEKILLALNSPHLLTGVEYRSTASLGVSLFCDQSASSEDLLQQADLALYSAKTAGRNTIRFFDPDMQATVAARGTLLTDLRRALQKQEFLVHYQPQVDRKGILMGAEALVRWQHPERGLLHPADFVPFAEEKGFIDSLGQWVLEAACVQLEKWQRAAPTAHLKIAVNVSAQEFRHPLFVDKVVTILHRTGANPSLLVLEFTESLMFGTITDTLAKMTALKTHGVRFSLDDFGIGYSSLAYLQSLPLDQLKIDQTFIRNLVTNPNDVAITRSVIALGNSLGLDVIAEGVETEEQHQLLAAHGCAGYQGFLFGRPVPAELLLPSSPIPN